MFNISLYLFIGRIIGSTRQGIPNMKDSTLMQASFEKTTEILYNAAMQGRDDLLKGVS
jgi:DNA-directed RNA polymerase III subunit RPC1